MVGMLDELMLGFQPPPGFKPPQSGGFPAQLGLLAQLFGVGQPSAPVTPGEEAAAAAPVMGQMPGIGIGGMAKPQPFVTGTQPIPGLLSGMETPTESPAAVATGPQTVTSLNGGGAIPLPKPRPTGADEISSRSVATQQPGAPMSLAPQAAYDTAPQRGFPTLPFNPSTMLALASGFAGAPSFGTGMRRAFGNAAPLMAQSEQQERQLNLTQTSQKQQYDALIAKGVAPQDAIAAIRNPAIMKELADRLYGAGKTPKTETFHNEEGKVIKQWNPVTQQWDLIPGQTPDPGDKRRSLSVADVKTLSKDARNMQAIGRYTGSFKDSYAGDVSETYGDIKNTIGDKVPGASAALKERSAWWRDYQEYRNAIRHGLYGSALTKAETENFLKQDITPGMLPEQIRTVLNRQNQIVTDALRREGKALIAAGHRKEAIAEAYGVEPSFFDGKASERLPSGTTRGGVQWRVRQ